MLNMKEGGLGKDGSECCTRTARGQAQERAIRDPEKDGGGGTSGGRGTGS
jgi:hypothetical protein